MLHIDPGTALHPAGQVNLQRVFERLAIKNQIVYSTHSLFMINHNRPERSRVVSKDERGTKLDQKPFLRNWHAVRETLGLILAGNFFIADTTLLVEGESDALYIGALLTALNRSESIDIDLNVFSVQWAGNSRNVEPMARLMLEEGRRVVALMDGDSGGDAIKARLERLNVAVDDKRVIARAPVEIIPLDRDQATEDILVFQDIYADSVMNTAEDLVSGGFRQAAVGLDPAGERKKRLAKPDGAGVTLGRHVEKTTKEWFAEEDPVSKLAIARTYCAALEDAHSRLGELKVCPSILKRLASALQLGTKLSEETVVAK